MRQRVKQLIKHPLISGSVVIFLGTLLANVLNFFFHLFMIKNLSKIDYGTLQSLISVITLPSVAAGAMIPLIVNFGASYFAKNEPGKLRGFYSQVGKFFFLFGLTVFIVFLLFIPQLAVFFHIRNYFLFFLVAVIIFLNFIGIINLALLQAKLAFNYLTLVTFLAALLKLLLGMVFVIIGYSVAGAIGAFVIAFLVSYLLTFIPLKFLFSKKVKTVKINTKSLFFYGVPSAITVIGMNSMISTDVILTKHFFTANLAGEYAGLSLIGKVIFFLTAPIITVMFPLIVQKYSKNENFTNTFLLSFIFIFSASIVMSASYFLIPHIIISIFAKKEYLELTQYLGFFAIFISLYSLVYLVANFYLAINKTKIFIPVIFFAVTQGVFIWFYHQSILVIIQISIVSTFFLLVTLLLYYPYATKKKNI